MSFHLAIGCAWGFIILLGARGHGASLASALASAAFVGILAAGLSLGAAQLFPDEPECTEQTPTGSGIC